MIELWIEIRIVQQSILVGQNLRASYCIRRSADYQLQFFVEIADFAIYHFVSSTMLNMTPGYFVGIIRTQVCEGAIAATLAALSDPPGREPRSLDIELSDWFNALSADAQLALRSVISETAEQAVFNLLALLDGVCPAQNDDLNGRLELSWVTDGRRYILNEASAEELHRLFAQPANECPQPTTKGLKAYEVREFSELLRRQSTADLMHLHRIPVKSAAIRMLPNYDPATATCMALPQGEHRRVESSR